MKRINKIQFGSRLISFELIFKERKSIGIKITPQLNIIVSAPYHTPSKKISDIVKKRAPWIIKQQSYFLSFHPLTPPKKFIGGESHLYLGKQYRLKLINRNEDSVKLKCGYIEVTTLKKENVKALVKEWYYENALKKFENRSSVLIEKFKKYGVKPKSIIVKGMKTRWGSCTPKGNIILNVDLIKAPLKCLDYVIIHELCHLVHKNHSLKFFNLQKKEMPDWEKWKNKLEHLMA